MSNSGCWHIEVLKKRKKNWESWCARKTVDFLNHKLDRVEFRMARSLYERKAT